MASGDTLLIFTALNNEPPAANYATFDTRNSHPVLDFDKATDEFAVFGAVLPRHYGGGGITVYLHWSATTVTTGDVIWGAAFERIGEGQQDIDADSFASAKTVTATAPGTSGLLDIAEIAFANGAEIDSIAVGEGFRLQIYRDANAAGDTADNDAELRFVELKET
jgi:hypothetical protein